MATTVRGASRVIEQGGCPPGLGLRQPSGALEKSRELEGGQSSLARPSNLEAKSGRGQPQSKTLSRHIKAREGGHPALVVAALETAHSILGYKPFLGSSAGSRPRGLELIRRPLAKCVGFQSLFLPGCPGTGCGPVGSADSYFPSKSPPACPIPPPGWAESERRPSHSGRFSTSRRIGAHATGPSPGSAKQQSFRD